MTQEEYVQAVLAFFIEGSKFTGTIDKLTIFYLLESLWLANH